MFFLLLIGQFVGAVAMCVQLLQSVTDTFLLLFPIMYLYVNK